MADPADNSETPGIFSTWSVLEKRLIVWVVKDFFYELRQESVCVSGSVFVSVWCFSLGLSCALGAFLCCYRWFLGQFQHGFETWFKSVKLNNVSRRRWIPV